MGFADNKKILGFTIEGENNVGKRRIYCFPATFRFPNFVFEGLFLRVISFHDYVEKVEKNFENGIMLLSMYFSENVHFVQNTLN